MVRYMCAKTRALRTYLRTCAWTLLSRPKYKVLIKISQGGRPLTGTKGFTVINQIYLQFIQMLNQQKYKKKNHKMQNQETSSLETPLLYRGLNVK